MKDNIKFSNKYKVKDVKSLNQEQLYALRNKIENKLDKLYSINKEFDQLQSRFILFSTMYALCTFCVGIPEILTGNMTPDTLKDIAIIDAILIGSTSVTKLIGDKIMDIIDQKLMKDRRIVNKQVYQKQFIYSHNLSLERCNNELENIMNDLTKKHICSEDCEEKKNRIWKPNLINDGANQDLVNSDLVEQILSSELDKYGHARRLDVKNIREDGTFDLNFHTHFPYGMQGPEDYMSYKINYKNDSDDDHFIEVTINNKQKLYANKDGKITEITDVVKDVYYDPETLIVKNEQISKSGR